MNIEIEDGILRNGREGTLFRSRATGKEILFRGVRTHVGGWYMPPYAAFQLFGHIHIGRRWQKEGFCVTDYAHEYGHYLQEKSIGHLRYVFCVAIPSVWSLLRNPRRHAEKRFEQEATCLGRDFLHEQQTRNIT
ncbi:MAG: hypothetical protein IJ692_04520 [Alloprevotella sp.]|nr:hypothetical protein [Alloprevotella sp.]MBR1652637.1 hypothetical protein [Alloprevotella sp.]